MNFLKEKNIAPTEQYIVQYTATVNHTDQKPLLKTVDGMKLDEIRPVKNIIPRMEKDGVIMCQLCHSFISCICCHFGKRASSLN
jgi:hypothetical protein